MGESERAELADTVAGWSGGEAAPVLLERGAEVGRYLVLEMIGAGGMGAVYAAYDPELDRKVAIKLVLPGADGSIGRARMLREAQAIARLSHPNVVTVHDVGTRADQVFVAMELVDGLTLSRWLRERARTVDEILEVFLQAGRGLAAAHQAGLVHRDFKPDNVLVGKDGRARVADFGLVRELEHPEVEPDTPLPSARPLSLDLTQAGSLMGTPAYMAPEQFLRRASDARTDQYSYCVALFEALHGAAPFEAGDLSSTAERVLAGEIPELQRKVPARVRAVLRRGLAVSPDDRFPSMNDLLAELARDPGAGRRRAALAAALLAVAGGVAVPLFASGGSGAAPCGGGEERLGGAWDPARRRAVEAAFRATGVPYARDSAAAVARSLDRYAGDWLKSWQDSCEATRVRGEQSSELQDLRTACLVRRRSELDALVDLMVEADPRMVQRAAAAAQALPPIAECDDLAALQAPVPPPRGEAAAREVASLRDESARLEAMVLAARWKDALPRAEALRARARVTGYRPLEAEITVMLAQVQSRTGQSDRAVASFREAAAAAIAGRHDDVAARALMYLVQEAGDTEEFARAHEWAALADAALERIGDPPSRRASFHHVNGYLLSCEGKFAASAAEHEKALAIRQRISPTSFETSRSLSSLAFAYDEVGRYADARAAGERALEIQRSELGPDHPDVALILNNLGNIASDEGDLARAADYYRRALAIREKTVAAGDDPAQLASVLNNLGIVALEQGRHEEALGLQLRALALREQVGADEPDAAMSHVNVGGAYLEMKRTGLALASYRRALAIAEKKLGPDHPYVGDALTGIGHATRELGRLEESQAAFERAARIRAAGARPTEVADVEFGLAQTLWRRGQRARALELAGSARAAFAGAPAGGKAAARVDAWLRPRAAR